MALEKTLKQDEIDALFEAARSTSPEAEHAEVRARVVPYNYASAGQISTDQLRAISLLNDLFARNLTHNLAAWLRSRFQVNLVSAEQIPFNEFLLRIPEICYVASVRLEPLGALSVLQLDLALAPPIIDLLLGGEGRDGPLRELTDIEESILGSVVDIICRELTAAWQTVGLSFSFDRRQMQTQVARIMSVTEKTLCLSFEIRMPHGSGLLNLAFPAVVANTILRRLATDWGKRRRHAGDARAVMEAAARQIHFGCSLQLPSVRVPASALENLAPGSLVRFHLPANTAPLWRVAGQPLHTAQAIRQGPHRAARIDLSLMSEPGAGPSPKAAAPPASESRASEGRPPDPRSPGTRP
jgi:flagellar motor switch protein FliM